VTRTNRQEGKFKLSLRGNMLTAGKEDTLSKRPRISQESKTLSSRAGAGGREVAPGKS
jgi:hypothetical protein